MPSGCSSFCMVRLYLANLVLAYYWIGSHCVCFAWDAMPTSMATRLPSMTALVIMSPGRSRLDSPNVYSRVVVGSTVLATAAIARTTE